MWRSSIGEPGLSTKTLGYVPLVTAPSCKVDICTGHKPGLHLFERLEERRAFVIDGIDLVGDPPIFGTHGDMAGRNRLKAAAGIELGKDVFLAEEVISVGIQAHGSTGVTLVLVIKLTSDWPKVGVRHHDPGVVVDLLVGCRVLADVLRDGTLGVAIDERHELILDLERVQRRDYDLVTSSVPIVFVSNQKDNRLKPDVSFPKERGQWNKEAVVLYL